MKKNNSSVGTSVLEYLGNFKALIDACGSISYYNNMKNFINAGSNKVKIVASAYQHDKRTDGNNSETPDLNKRQYDRLPELTPVVIRICHDKTGNAHGSG